MQSEEEQIKALTGKRRGPYHSFNSVSPTQIWQWCAVMGETKARHQPSPEQTAPLAMMQMWTMRDFYDEWAPGSTSDRPYQVFDDLTAMGYSNNVAVSYDIQFLRYLKVGERPVHFTTVVKITDKKTTALGQGFFVTERVEYTTVDDVPFAEAHITYFQYKAAEASGDHGSDDSTSAKAKWIEPSSGPFVQDRPVPISAVDPSQVGVGMMLPTRDIPITHRLIVGGAIATQDFIPVHHNLAAAVGAAMPDIFMNILTTSGLVMTYLSDWAGEGFVRRLRFNLMAPNVPGDSMQLQGGVTEFDTESCLASIEFAGLNQVGVHVKGAAEIQF